MASMIDKYGMENCFLYTDKVSDGDDSSDWRAALSFHGWRWETAEECASRLEKWDKYQKSLKYHAEKESERKLEKERKEYERLKAKFEKSGDGEC